MNDKIYVIGGQDEFDQGGVVEEYDPATDLWPTKAPMPTPRFYLGAVALGGRIYTIGGETDHGGGFRPTVEDYDPVADFWSAEASMHTLRMGLATAVVGGSVYAVGGNFDGIQLVANEEFVPGTRALYVHAKN